MEYRWGCDTCSYKAEGCEKCKESPFLSRPKARWDPNNALPQDAVVDAPSFYPTAEEFCDPLGYLQKIAPQVAPYGIAHVVPPQGWHPPSPLLDPATGMPRGDLFIPVRRQPTHLLCRRFPTSDGGPPLASDPNNSSAAAAAAAPAPLVGDASPKRNLGRKRFEEEPRMGMLKVAKGMGMSGAQTEESFGFEDLAHPFTLQEFHIYNTWAMQQHFSGHDTQPQEQEQQQQAAPLAAAGASPQQDQDQQQQQLPPRFHPSIPQIEAEFWRIVEKAEEQVEALYGSDVDTSKYTSGFPKRAAAIAKLAAAPPAGSGYAALGGPTDASKQKDNWAADAEACCCACHAAAASALGKRTASGSMAQGGPSPSSSQSGAATSVAASSAGSSSSSSFSGMCPCAAAVLGQPSNKVCWACAVKGYSLHPWNINNIPTAPDSVLRFVREGVRGLPINGMMVPWLYAGSCFSSFSWHIEDHGLYSINYNHLGANKVWYGVPGHAAAAFDTAMQDALPHLFAADPNLLHRLTTLVSPQQLAARGIPVCRVVHQPGSFVITFPDAYHAGFNSGFNVAEAVNFAMPDWLPCGTASVTKYKAQRRPTTFGYDAMLVNIVAASVHTMLQKQWAEQKQRQQAAKKQKRGLPPLAGASAAGADAQLQQQQQQAAEGGADGTSAEAAEGRASPSPAAEAAVPPSSAAAALPAPSSTSGEVATEAAPHPAGLLQYLMPTEAAAAVAQALQAGRLAPFPPADCSLWADWYKPAEWWRLLQLMDPALAPLLQPAPLLIAVGAGAAQQLKTVKVDKDPAPRLVDLFRHVELAPWQRALPAAEQKLLTLPPSDSLAAAAAGELVVRLAGEAAVVDAAIKGGQLGGVALMRGSEMARCPTTGVHTCTKSCECRVCGCDLTLAGVVSPAAPGVTVCPLHAAELPGSPNSKVLLLRHLPGAVQQLLQALQDHLPAAKEIVAAAKARLQQGVPSSTPADAAAAAALKVVQEKVGQLQEERRQQAAAAAAKEQQAKEENAAVPAAAEAVEAGSSKPAAVPAASEQPGSQGGPAPAAEEKPAAEASVGAAAMQHLTKSIQLLQERLADLQQQLTKFEGVRRQLEAVTAGNPTAQGHLAMVLDKEAGLQQRYKHLDGLRQELMTKAEALKVASAAAAAVKALPSNSGAQVAAAAIKQEPAAAAGDQQQQQAVVVKQEPGAVEPARSTSSGDSTHTRGGGAAADAVSGPAVTTAQSAAARRQVVVRRLGKLYEPQQLSAALFEDLEEPEEETPAVKEEQEAAAAAAAAVAAAAAAVAALDADKGNGPAGEAQPAAAAAVEAGEGKPQKQEEEVREWALKEEVKEDEFGFVTWGDAVAPGKDASKAPAAAAAAAAAGAGTAPGDGAQVPGEGDEGKRRNRGTKLRLAVAAVAAAQRPDTSDSEDGVDQGDTSDEEFKVGGKRSRRSRPRERKRVRAASPAEGQATAETQAAPSAATVAAAPTAAAAVNNVQQEAVAAAPAAAEMTAAAPAEAAAQRDVPVVQSAPAIAAAPAPAPAALSALAGPQLQQAAAAPREAAVVTAPAMQQHLAGCGPSMRVVQGQFQEAARAPAAAVAAPAAPPAVAAPCALPVRPQELPASIVLGTAAAGSEDAAGQEEQAGVQVLQPPAAEV